MILLLIIGIITMLGILFLIHKRDIMYPSVFLCIVYLLSIGFAMTNYELWDLRDYSIQATATILMGIGTFALVGIGVEKVLFAGRRTVVGRSRGQQPSVIIIPTWLLILDLVYCFFVMMWFLIEVRRIAGRASNWSLMMSFYRAKTAGNILANEERMPFLLRQLLKIIQPQGFLFEYVLINNIVVRGFKKKDVFLFLPLIIHVLFIIFNAIRLDLLAIIVFFLSASYILWHRKNGWNRNISMKYIRIGAVVFVGTMVGFYLLKGAVGRIGDVNPLYYLSVYAGGPIKTFELYLKSPPAPSNIWGSEAFYNIVNAIYVLQGHYELKFPKNLEFRGVNGVNVGNVYSALRRYHHDFGMIGMIILVAIFSFIMHYFYCKVKYSKVRRASFATLVYCYLFFTVAIFPIDDHFFSSYISLIYPFYIFVMYTMYVVLVKKKIRFRKTT